MFARTNRLLLRPGWAEDAAALAQAIGDEAVVRNLATAPWPYGEAEAEAFLAAPRDDGLPNMLLFQRTEGAPRLVGGCGIGENPDGQLELGYWIARPFWGLGYATEAARQLMQIRRAMGLPRLTASHMIDNPASGHVLRKIGFRATGQVGRRHSAARGANVGVVLFEEAGDADGGDVPAPMSGRMTRRDDARDPREDWRLMAA